MLWMLACNGEVVDEPVVPEIHALVDDTWTTLQRRWAPVVPSEATYASIDAEEVTVFDWTEYRDYGLGVVEEEGSTWTELADLAPDFEEGADRRSVGLIWQSADPQVIDEESPIRLSAWADLYRPQGHLSVFAWEAHVRTAQRISEISGGFDFALVAGDLTDGGQKNELSWVLTALEGGVIDPDSGADDATSFNHPFESEGLDTEWYAAVGNHDVLYNGGFDKVTEEIREAAAGEEVYEFLTFPNGFRDGSSEGAEVLTEGPTPADPDRIPLTLSEFLVELADAGHVETQTGYFAVQASEAVKLIVLNTVDDQPEGLGKGSAGWMDETQLAWLAEELDTDALVLVMSHHRAKDFDDDSPVSGDELVEVLDSPSLVLHVTGHGHSNTKGLRGAENGYWELMLASTLDFPIQSRVIELVDEQNGYLSIYCTNLEDLSATDSPAHHSRELAAGKLAFPAFAQTVDIDSAWASDVANQNLLLRVPLTVEQQARLEDLDGREVVSTTVLAEL